VSKNVCPKCQGSGWDRVERDGVEGVVRCECLKGSRFERYLISANIPRRYEHCELDNFDNPFQNRSTDIARVAAEKFVAEYPMPQPFGLLFMGPQGIGKTHLAVGIIKKLIRQKSIPSLFCTFPELLKEIQDSWNPVSQSSEMTLLEPVLNTEVLVLDELGAQKPSDWVRDQVAYVLNYRYNENKVTIITTNFLDHGADPTKEDRKNDSLSQRIGERIRSRLFEMCKTIKMDGKDFRAEIKQANHHF
jgi:DNA replication protein DnaC